MIIKSDYEDNTKKINMEYAQLTDAQHSLVVSLEEQFERKGTLSDKQMDVLESIFQYANEK